MNTTTYQPRCREYRSRSSFTNTRCGEPATMAFDGQPICKKHAGYRKRSYRKNGLREILPGDLTAWAMEAAEQAEAKKVEDARKKVESDARRKAAIIRAKEEDAQEWESVRDDEEEIDWSNIKERATILIPRWSIQTPDGVRAGSFSNMGVKVVEREGFPPVLDVRSSSEITPKQAKALAKALLDAAVVAELRQDGFR